MKGISLKKIAFLKQMISTTFHAFILSDVIVLGHFGFLVFSRKGKH
jgi:hypothetical protein